MSCDIAITIFWKFSACSSCFEFKDNLSNLLTPSTNSATFELNSFFKKDFGIPESSITSCSIAAVRQSSSILNLANISATATGWVTYGSPLDLNWPE